MWENPLFRNLGSNTVTLIDCIFDNPILDISGTFLTIIFLTNLIFVHFPCLAILSRTTSAKSSNGASSNMGTFREGVDFDGLVSGLLEAGWRKKRRQELYFRCGGETETRIPETCATGLFGGENGEGRGGGKREGSGRGGK